MYRLREFTIADLPTLRRELPDQADDIDRLAGRPDGSFGLVVEDPRRRVCACLVAARRRLTGDKRDIDLGIVRVAHVRKEARIGGAHSLLFELDAAFAELFEGPDRAVQAVVARWDERDVWWFRRLRGFEPIAASTQFAGLVAVPPDAPELRVERFEAGRVEPGDLSVGGGAGLCRCPESLLHAALLPGRRASVVRRDARVVAWAVARDENAGVVVEDVAVDWTDQRLVVTLLAAVAGGHPLRTTRWTDQAAELAALQAAGLRLGGPEHLLAARVSASGLAPVTIGQSGSFGEADVGARALPRLTHNDCIVTPPPPGTRDTATDHRRDRRTRKVHAR